MAEKEKDEFTTVTIRSSLSEMLKEKKVIDAEGMTSVLFRLLVKANKYDEINSICGRKDEGEKLGE